MSKKKMSVEDALEHPDKLGEGAKKRKKLKNKNDKMKAVMQEWKRGTLHSGNGKKVPKNRQDIAIAIGLSEAGMSKKSKKRKKGK